MIRIFFLLMAFLTFPMLAQEQFSVYFDSNRSELTPKEAEKLAAWMKANPDVKIVAISGFTDEDGTTGHNDSLSSRRVRNIFDKINGKIRLREDFRTRSFGEQHAQAGDKASNRKAVLYYLLPADIPRENEILGITPEKPKTRTVTYPERISIENPNGTTSEFKLNVAFMQQVAQSGKGDKLTLADLNFQLNTFAIMNESRGKLYELLIVMQKNPTLKIDIQGHLCCSTGDKQDLSTKRAKAVQQFLVMNGIEKSRLTYQGFGVTQPKFAIPEQSEAERAANRRVEIMIVEN